MGLYFYLRYTEKRLELESSPTFPGVGCTPRLLAITQ